MNAPIYIKTCPVCHQKNVTPAHLMGHMTKGVPKTISKADAKHRAERLAANRYRGGRKPGATNLKTRAAEAKP